MSTGYPDLDAWLPRLEAIPGLGAEALEAEHTAILGRKSGALTAALKTVATLPVEERKRFGAAVNQLKARFEEARRRCRDELAKHDNDPVLRRALQLFDGVLAAGLLE